MPILIIIVIALAAWFLIQKLRHESKVEDCMLSGRRDCVPLDLSK